MPQASYSQSEEEKRVALEAIRRAREKALKADRATELAASRKHFAMPKAQVLLQGGEQGLLHGFADDISRAMVDKDRLETMGDKIYADTGERVAVNQVLAKASDPTLYGLGELGGAGLAGLLTRGLFKGAGGAMKWKAGIEKGADIGRAEMRVSQADRAREALAAESRFAKKAARAERVGNAGLPSNRAQAMTFDTAHGATMGYGGLDPNEDEGAIELDRALRALGGGAVGLAFAPTMAAGANYTGQAGKFAQQEMGMMPRTPLRRNKLKEGRTAEDVIAQMLGMDEFAARQARDGGAGRMQGSEPNPLIYATGQNTRGLVDSAIASPGGRGVVASAVPGAPTEKQTRLVSRMASAPQGGQPAQEMAETIKAEGANRLQDFLLKFMTKGGGPGTLTDIDRELLPALMKAYEGRDAAVAGDWANMRGRLSEAGRSDLRKQIFQQMLKRFSDDGADGVLGLVNDPNVRPFLDAGGYRSEARQIEQFTNRDGKHRAIARIMQELKDAAGRDEKGATPFFANRSDQRAARYSMDPGAAREVADAAMPQSAYRIPRYVEPVDPAGAPAVLEPTRAPLGDYMREAGRSTRDKLFGREDFSAADVAGGGAAATAVAALAEDQLIGPMVRALLESGMTPEEILQSVQTPPAGQMPRERLPVMP